MSDSTKDFLLKIGVVLMVITGVFPLQLGLRNHIKFQVSFYNPNQLWTARDQKGPAPYTLNNIRAVPDGAIAGKEIKDFGGTLADNLVTMTQSGYVNIATTGALVILITVFGLRKRRKWAFWVLLCIGVWAGMNDLIGMFKGGIVFPLAIWPTILGTPGLLMTAPAIFFEKR
ncbi:hypothetical protein HYR99_18585 [Candidatus Poribacteria bacterium]|nr:hypothetical protein [Candidatus Poribacteria bacterium]